MIQFAERHGEICHVSEVPSGLVCECMCVACGGQLIARKGSEVTHHFAHRDTFDCDGGWEGLTHSRAKQLIAETRHLFVPVHDITLHDYSPQALHRPVLQKVKFDRVNTEVSLGKYRIDLEGIHTSGKRLAIEIAVTSACSRRKRKFLRQQREPAIEIYLNQLREGFTLDEFEEQVLRTAPRIWIYNNRFEQKRTQDRRRRSALRSDLERRAEQYESALLNLRHQVRDLAMHSGDRPFTGILQLRNLKDFDIPFRTLCVYSESELLAEYQNLAAVEERYVSKLEQFQGRTVGFYLLPDESYITVKSKLRVPFPKARIAWIEGVPQDKLKWLKYRKWDPGRR